MINPNDSIWTGFHAQTLKVIKKLTSQQGRVVIMRKFFYFLFPFCTPAAIILCHFYGTLLWMNSFFFQQTPEKNILFFFYRKPKFTHEKEYFLPFIVQGRKKTAERVLNRSTMWLFQNKVRQREICVFVPKKSPPSTRLLKDTERNFYCSSSFFSYFQRFFFILEITSASRVS